MFRRLGDLADPFLPDPPHNPPTRVWPFLKLQLRPLRHIITASLLFSAASAAVEVWLIFYTGQLVDTLAATTPARLWAEHGLELVLVAALFLILRPLLWTGRESLDDIAFRPNAATGTRWRLHRHVLGQSVGWFRKDLAGRIASRVTELTTAATGAAYTVLHTLSFVGMYIVGSFWLMSAQDIRLAIPLALWIGLYFAVMAYVVPRYRRASQRHQSTQSALTGLLVDTYANIDTIKMSATGTDDPESRRRFADNHTAHLRLQRVEVTINASMMALGTILTVGLVGYSIALWQTGAAPLGLVAASLALSLRVNGIAEWLLDAVTALFGCLGAMREHLPTIAQPLEITDAPTATDLTITGGAIRLHDVSHHYGKETGGLDRVCLNIPAGQKIGLVGRSGAGKSTLVNLILRFFDAESGTITIDDQNIRAVTQDSLRHHIALVSQDASLLHRSVAANITGGVDNIDRTRITEAARKAAADGFIPTLRDATGRTGYDAHVGERGVTLSGGQRQRIALARAFLTEAPILVLDEATSALDSESEAAIQETLSEIMADKTVIAIAHRLSTIAHLDRIVVLDEGRIVEDGSHDQLLTTGGIYADLWKHQSGGFLSST
ncbi:ABC transporter ATP-binding protein [Stackebrandtia nassauensis]|uniref:ABC transporter related protein n=1 Tax=Stackebrandtia nassauensis (strain DSM 44728 / CIP 108903 / NRRL B-16338 / NBRC 102104 / LLR-40K-21) TaxID=446470 RepID=D3PTX6_STANL|nr:ABC transporter ATP-binding protein [Stackebrandtia nassauensis]ADD39734.1 ABC transporter related protein [Stackebrandtia nassauensis DSM 44728]